LAVRVPRGLLNLKEMAKRLDVSPATVLYWRRAGLLVAHRYEDRGQCLFEPPGPGAPTKYKHEGKTHGRIAASMGSPNGVN
jgi:transposase